MAMPTAAARPWPSGPVVVSTPGVWPYSGWPGVLRTELAEALDLSCGPCADSREMQQRIEQHRTMSGGQHEAVAIGPGRIGGIEFHEAREQDGGDIRHAHRHAGMTANWLFRQRPSTARGWRWPFRRASRCQKLSPACSSIFRPWVSRFLRSTNWRMSGVSISCIARSSLLPGMTIELARDMKLSRSIDRR